MTVVAIAISADLAPPFPLLTPATSLLEFIWTPATNCVSPFFFRRTTPPSEVPTRVLPLLHRIMRRRVGHRSSSRSSRLAEWPAATGLQTHPVAVSLAASTVYCEELYTGNMPLREGRSVLGAPSLSTAAPYPSLVLSCGWLGPLRTRKKRKSCGSHPWRETLRVENLDMMGIV